MHSRWLSFDKSGLAHETDGLPLALRLSAGLGVSGADEREHMRSYRLAMQQEAIFGDALMGSTCLSSHADAGDVALGHYDLDATELEAM